MGQIRILWQHFFDVRRGEYLRTLFMALYLLCVLFAYYILKPVSRALFLNKFDIDKLPWLYILIAGFGGTLAYLYTKLAVKASLKVAVGWAMALTVLCLVAIWWLIGLNLAWVFYFFNIWVSLFSVVLVSQGWLVAANVFNSREAKRLYGLLGLGAVVGAAFGGSFTAYTVKFIGTRNLLLASAGMVILAYGCFRLVVAQKGVSLAGARAAGEEEVDFSFGEIAIAIRRYRHLQVIIGIMVLTFIADVLIEYQFNAMAKIAYGSHKEALTAFLGNFYGLYLNLITFTLQFFLTGAMVKWLGVGGILQIMPVAITATSTFTFLAPGVTSTAAVRLTEAATRYTLNRTGMELLYLPLPVELKNRTKAFVDIFVDRMARGMGGMLLVLLTQSVFHLSVKQISLVTVGFALIWMVLSWHASREYVATVRKRLESRRLDLESARVTVRDRATLALVEQAAAGPNPRQASYALSLLAEVPGYDLRAKLQELAGSQLPEVRAKTYELAQSIHFPGLLDRALKEIHSETPAPEAIKPALAYIVTVSPAARRSIRKYLDDPNHLIATGALEALSSDRELAHDVISHEWLSRVAQESDPHRRALAATAIGILGDQGTEALHRLLADSETEVVAAACRSAGALQNRAYLDQLVTRLSHPRLRAVAIEALAAYGTRICGTLGDILEDEKVPMAIRRNIPRVLKLIPDQRSVDVLLHAFRQQDLVMRAAVLKALNRLRETASNLDYGTQFVNEQIMQEARHYFELVAALAPFRDQKEPRTAASLLARTLEERLRLTLERLFRLLGLRYPPKEIYSAYLAVNRRRSDEFAAALEFLDNVLERELKRILLPLLDAPESLPEKGRDLFGVKIKDAETAIRELIRSGDPWLSACAMAAAAELKIRRLAPEIAEAAKRASDDVAEVARSAAAVLA